MFRVYSSTGSMRPLKKVYGYMGLGRMGPSYSNPRAAATEALA